MKGLNMRQFEAIDLLKLYSNSNTKKWNSFLTNCLTNGDINTLTMTRYGLQAGMDDLAKKKLNTEKMILWFIRLQRSLEKTIKDILRKKEPNPCDDPLRAINFIHAKIQKTNRDDLLERFLRKKGY